MSIRYRNANGESVICAGLTPGGELAYGTSTTRSGNFSITFDGSSTSEGNVQVTFSEPMPDADYQVDFSYNGQWTGAALYANNKTANGFNVCYANIVSSTATRTYNYKAYKLYEVQHAQENAEDIANIKTVIPSAASASNQLTTKSYVDNADNALDARLDNIEDVIPVGASISNQLVTKNEASVDSALSSTSEHAVQNKVVKAALDAKQNTLTFDSAPTQGSTNPVQSGGTFNAIKAVSDDVDNISDEIADMNNVLGAKNILFNDTVTQTVSGVTCTVNSDGSISTNGVYTSSDGVFLRINQNFTVSQSGEYILTGTPFIQQEWTFLLYIADNISGSIIAFDLGQGVKCSLDSSTTYSVVGWCKPNFDTSGYNIKPMIRPASIQDDTYVPYSMTNREMTPYVQAISNPNLLDNPWFTINQRGITDSWNTQFSVGVDRWAKSSDSSSTLEVTTDGIAEVDGKAFSIYQVLDNTMTNYESIKRLYGKTLMLSVLFSDGTIETGSYNLPLSDYRPSTNQIRTFINNSTRIKYARIESFAVGNVNLAIRVKAGNVIRAVKLEIGTVSTLINDTAPNYQQELAKCQKYFVRYKSSNNSYKPIGFGFMSSTTDIRLCIPLPTSMRTTPTLTFSDLTKFRVYPGATNITEPSVIGLENNILNFKATTNQSMTQYATCIITDTTLNEYIDISADL